MPHPPATKSKGRVLVLSNPDVESDDDPQTQGHSPPQPSLSQPPCPIKHPTRLTTDLPHHITSSHSNPTLSSPSSQSSNAVESTPPPSTPGQAIPPDIGAPFCFTHDDGSAVNERTEVPHPNTFQKISDKIWKRRPSTNRPLEPDSSLHVGSYRSSSDLSLLTRLIRSLLLLPVILLPRDFRTGSSWSLMIAMHTPLST